MLLEKLQNVRKNHPTSLIDTYRNRRHPNVDSIFDYIESTEQRRAPESETVKKSENINFPHINER